MTLGEVLQKVSLREVVSIFCRSVQVFQGRLEDLTFNDFPKIQDQQISRVETSLIKIEKDVFPVLNLVIDTLIDFVGV